jgi:hypothetical protein
MKTAEKKAFLDLAESMGYEVQSMNDGGDFPGGGRVPTLGPDGNVTVTETTSLVLVKKTVYPAKA